MLNFFISLYSMRYGDLFLRSHNLCEEKRGYKGVQSNDWHEVRTKIYFEIIKELKFYNLFTNLVNICVFDQFPDFLTKINVKAESTRSYTKLKHSIEIISSYIEKNYSQVEDFLV